MKCPKCGKVVLEGKFCPECGEKLLLNESNIEDKEENEIKLESENTKEPISANIETSHSAKDKGKRNVKPFVLTGILIALVLIAVLSTKYVKDTSLSPSEKAEVASMIESINKLPDDVKANDEGEIKKISNNYILLNDNQKKKVKNRKKLHKAEKVIEEIKVNEVIEAINKIGNVTEESGDNLSAAQKKYDALSDSLKKSVSNYDKLISSQHEYNNLFAEKIVSQINNLGKISLSSETIIKEIRDSYDDLSPEAQALVTNYDSFAEAEKEFIELKKKESKKDYEKSLKDYRIESDSIRGYTWYYPKAFPNYTNTRSFFLPYLCTDIKTKEIVSLQIRANYYKSGARWLFIGKITVNVDDENYYYNPTVLNVTRDSNYPDYWEYYDFSASDEDIEMLRKISKSKKTIVRFEGTNKYHDVELSESDKNAIKQIINTYDLYNYFIK